ncbi:MAG: hypothetical protein ACE5GO_12110, partial [Anaerolineales bacterium]
MSIVPGSLYAQAGTVVVAALDGAGIDKGEGKWFAQVSLTVEDGGGNPVGNVEVFYNFGGETKKQKTNGNGQLTVKSETFEGGPDSVIFNIPRVNHPSYDAAGSLTSITIYAPWAA